MKKTKTSIILLALIALTSCKMADMRTKTVKTDGATPETSQKGKTILNNTWKIHGFENLDKHKNYMFTGKDTWKGMMGKMGKPWPEAESKMRFKYEVGSFDSQVTFLDGKRAGVTSGIQSWNYYEIDTNGNTKHLDMNKKIRFGLSAYHYFFEMLDRLKNAPIILYGGQTSLDGNTYDIVFATWEKIEPHRENDQYKLLINTETGRLDYAVYSLRENYLKFPGSGTFYGSIKYDDYREIDGLLIPHQQTVFLNYPKEKIKRHVHQLIVSEFEFDQFDTSVLKPLEDITETGDSKVKG